MAEGRGIAGLEAPTGGGIAGLAPGDRGIAGLAPAEPGLISQIGGGIWTGVTTPLYYAMQAWDLPRRGIAYAGYRLGGFSHEEAYRASRTGRDLIATMSPTWAREHPGVSTVLGILQEISADPMNLMLIGEVTAAGRAIQKTGKLTGTWAKQAQAGNRALLQITIPTFKGGWSWSVTEGLQRIVLARTPKGVAGLAKVGHGLAYPFSFLRARTWHPGARVALEAFDAGGLQIHPKLGYRPVTRLMALEETLDTLQKAAGPETMRLVEEAAEHLGKTSQFHLDALKRFNPDVIRLAEQYAGLQHSMNDVGQVMLGMAPNSGGDVGRALDEAKHMRSGEIQRLNRELHTGIGALRGTRDRVVTDALNLRAKADELQRVAFRSAEQEWEIARRIEAGGLGPDVARQFQERSDFYAQQATAATRGARQADTKAYQLEMKALRYADQADALPDIGKLDYRKVHKLDARIKGLEGILGDAPNAVPRVIGPRGLKAVKQFEDLQAPGRYIWSDAGMWEARRFVNRFDKATLKKLKPGEKALKELTIPSSLKEVGELMREAPLGGRTEVYAEVAKGGFIERFGDWIRGSPVEAKLERFYKMGEGLGLKRLSQRLITRIKTREMFDTIRNMPDVFRKTLPSKPGWRHIGLISEDLVKEIGEGYIRHELFTELTRAFTNIQLPDSLNTVLRAYETSMRFWKRSMTQPWPAYHTRNALSDTILVTSNGLVSPKAYFVDGTQIAWYDCKASQRFFSKKVPIIDCGKGLGKVPADEFRRMARALGLTYGEVGVSGARGVGMRLENGRRYGYFLDRLRAGFSPSQAALEVKKVLYDYSRLSPFERTYMRKVFPFWSWFRNNVARHTQMLGMRPAYIQAQYRIGLRYEKLEDVPSWVRGRGMVLWDRDEQTDTEKYLIGLGLPLEDLSEMLDVRGGYSEWLRQLMFRANPLLKVGMGVATGVMTGTGSDLERGRMLDKPVRADYLRWLHKNDSARWAFAQKVFGARVSKQRDGTTRYTIGPYWDFVIRSMPYGRGLSTLKMFAREDATPQEKAFGLLTGVRIIEHERARARRYEAWQEREKQLRKRQRVGDVRMFRKAYRAPGGMISDKALRELTSRRTGD